MNHYLGAWMRHSRLNDYSLADEIGCNHSTVNRWRRGQRRLSLDALEKCAEAMNLGPGDLLQPPPADTPSS